MGTETIQVSGVIHASPDRIYQAWLDSEEHSRFTGGKASVESGIGGKFSAWDGYIQGTTLELEPGRRIVQSWRSTDFPSDSGDSRVEIHFEPVEDGCRVVLMHSDIPTGQGPQYEQGWKEHYLEPLARYFANQGGVVSGAAEVIEDTTAVEEELTPTAPPPIPKRAAASKPKAAKPKVAKRKAAARRPAAKPAAKAKKAAKGKRVSAKAKAARSRKAAPKRRPAKKKAAKKASRKRTRR